MRNYVLLTVELVFEGDDEGYELIFSIYFSGLSKTEEFISLLIDVSVGNDKMEIDLKRCSRLFTVEKRQGYAYYSLLGPIFDHCTCVMI